MNFIYLSNDLKILIYGYFFYYKWILNSEIIVTNNCELSCLSYESEKYKDLYSKNME